MSKDYAKNQSTPTLENDLVGLTETEWEALPVTFGAEPMARLIHSNLRWVQDHAEELGGHKLGGRWIFSKPRAAELLGL